MKELFTLTKVFFRTSLDVSKKKGKQIGSYFYIICIGLLFGILTALLCYFFYRGLLISPEQLAQNKHAIVVACLVFLSFFGIMFNFFSMYASLFKAKDFDFLASAPLKKSNIIGAKLLALFFYSFIIDGIAMIPVIIFYMVNGGTAVGCICAIIGTIFAGVLPLLFATLVGAIVGLITAKLRNGETISIIIYLLLFIGFTVGIIVMTGSSAVILSSYKILPYYRFLNDTFIDNSNLGVLWFTLINIGACIFVVVFTSIIYFPVNQMKRNNGNGKYVHTKERTSFTTTRILFKKEINMVVRNLAFVLSTYAMPIIFFVVGLVVIGFVNKGFLDTTPETLNKVIGQLNYYQLVVCVLVGSLSVTTYASFSMEGRDNLQQLIVYPLDRRKIINAKIKASIIPTSILFVITNLILLIIISSIQGFSKIPVWTWLNLLLLPAFSVVVSSFVGALCGIKWVKLDFVDPNDVLKKSKAMGYTMLFSVLINGVALMAALIIGSFLKGNAPYLGLVIGISVEIIAIVVLAICIHKYAIKMFEKSILG